MEVVSWLRRTAVYCHWSFGNLNRIITITDLLKRQRRFSHAGGEHVEVRHCRIGDLASLRDIAIQTYTDTFARDNTPENNAAYIAGAFSSEKLREELRNPASSFYLAVEGGEVIGYLKLNEAPAQTELNDARSLEIERIYVAEAFHGLGCGKRLLEKAIAIAGERGKDYVWLGVWEKNGRAIRFYEKHGFQRCGEHVFQLGGDKQLDYLMRKELPTP